MSKQYLVPKRVTTHVEVLPGTGIGVKEGLAVLASAALGVGVLYATGAAGLPAPFRAALAVIPPTLTLISVIGDEDEKGYKQLLRAWRYHRSPKRYSTTVERGRQARPMSEWYPVQGLHDCVMVRRDGTLVAAIRITPVNMVLLAPKEQEQLVEHLHRAINGITYPVQILSIYRPLDISQYVAGLEQRCQEVSPRRRMLLRQQINYIRHMMATASALERRFYLLVSHPGRNHPDATDEILKRVHDLANRLRGSALTVSVCDGAELQALLEVWANQGVQAQKQEG